MFDLNSLNICRCAQHFECFSLSFPLGLNLLSHSSCTGQIDFVASSLFAFFSTLFCNNFCKFLFPSLSSCAYGVWGLLACFALLCYIFFYIIICLMIYEIYCNLALIANNFPPPWFILIIVLITFIFLHEPYSSTSLHSPWLSTPSIHFLFANRADEFFYTSYLQPPLVFWLLNLRNLFIFWPQPNRNFLSSLVISLQIFFGGLKKDKNDNGKGENTNLIKHTCITNDRSLPFQLTNLVYQLLLNTKNWFIKFLFLKRESVFLRIWKWQ